MKYYYFCIFIFRNIFKKEFCFWWGSCGLLSFFGHVRGIGGSRGSWSLVLFDVFFFSPASIVFHICFFPELQLKKFTIFGYRSKKIINIYIGVGHFLSFRGPELVAVYGIDFFVSFRRYCLRDWFFSEFGFYEVRDEKRQLDFLVWKVLLVFVWFPARINFLLYCVRGWIFCVVLLLLLTGLNILYRGRAFFIVPAIFLTGLNFE